MGGGGGYFFILAGGIAGEADEIYPTFYFKFYIFNETKYRARRVSAGCVFVCAFLCSFVGHSIFIVATHQNCCQKEG